VPANSGQQAPPAVVWGLRDAAGGQVAVAGEWAATEAQNGRAMGGWGGVCVCVWGGSSPVQCKQTMCVYRLKLPGQ
jgi:hypothetical protein